jgi:hypothetical protein
VEITSFESGCLFPVSMDFISGREHSDHYNWLLAIVAILSD